jgi:hypothetical protein
MEPRVRWRPLKKADAVVRNPSPMPGPSPRHGLTILTLLVVLLALSLVAATSIRWYFSDADVTLQNAAVLLARDVRAAQHRAIFLGEPGRLSFLPGGAGYVLLDRSGASVRDPHTDEPFLRVYSDDGVFLGVHVLEAVAGTDAVLEIDSHGNPVEDLRVTLGFGDARRTLLLDHRTGVITIEGSTSDWSDAGP